MLEDRWELYKYVPYYLAKFDKRAIFSNDIRHCSECLR